MIHKGALDTYETIANTWVHPKFPYSERDGWGRMSFFGPFGHYVLSHLRGDLLEIGAGESSVYFNQLAKIYGCKTYHCDIQLGVLYNAQTVPGYFCDDNILLDAGKGGPYDTAHQCVLYAGPSDSFFRDIMLTPIAMAFIDGDHSYEQARKDFFNVLPYMMENGFILLHDTYPMSEENIRPTSCGTVYKLRQELEKDDRFDCMTLVKGTAQDFGLTIIRIKPKALPFYKA
jgi:hypothetical protein